MNHLMQMWGETLSNGGWRIGMTIISWGECELERREELKR